jgi:hypothetical protein
MATQDGPRRFVMIGGRVMRITRTDGCGVPAYGERARLITEGFISVEATANTTDRDEVTVDNANGKRMARRPPKSTFSSWSVNINLVGVDIDAVEMTTGNPPVLDGSGTVAGFDTDTDVDPEDSGFALEVWSDLAGADACADGEEKWGWLALPFMQGGSLADWTIENDAVNFSINNAQSKTGHAWGEGPYLVDVDETGEPVALAAIPPSVALRVLKVGLPPPEESNGAIPLDNPDADPATGATAGTPGSFTPADSFRPETLDDMTGITADPLTAWTGTQYVELQNGDHVKWNGTAWVLA